ncbi:hypothetical protein C8F04DRAFT_1394419 [Mycena alexandri]|uniref:Secreted protein n=1 Tax=Mycena alexandri TaxID=1745969 RepID=A0AAD6T2L3_9AGAR|nr:hypothetical protein C8F04DRAFT_1394419 [Mycena alexandri]
MRYTPAIAIAILAAITAVAAAPAPAPGVGAPGPVISYFSLRRYKGVGGRRPKRDDSAEATDDDPDDFPDSRALAVSKRDDDTGGAIEDNPDDCLDFDFDSRALAVKEAGARRDDDTGEATNNDPDDLPDLDTRALDAAPAPELTSEENKPGTPLAGGASSNDEAAEQPAPEAELVEQPESSSMDCYYQLIDEFFVNDGGLEN